MKVIKSIFIVFILNCGFLYAQTNNLQATFSRNNQTQNFEFTVTLNISTEIQNEFYLEWPENMKAVLKSVRVNDQEFWLKNETGAPDRKNVVFWQSDDRGIMLSFQKGDLSAEDLLVLNFMPHNVNAISDSASVALKNVVDQGDQQKIPGQVVMTQNLTKPASE